MPRRRRAWVSCRASTISAGGPSATFPSRRRRRRRHRHSPQRSLRWTAEPTCPVVLPVVFVQFVFMRERLFDMNSHIEQTKNGSLPQYDVGWAVVPWYYYLARLTTFTGTIPPLSSLTWKEAYYGWQLFRLNRRAGFGIISMRRVSYERSERSYLSGVRIM